MCKMCYVSTLEYFKEFFKAAVKRVQFRMYLRVVEHEQFRMIFQGNYAGKNRL